MSCDSSRSSPAGGAAAEVLEKRRQIEEDLEDGTLETEEEKAELEVLETKLALMKQKHGVKPAPRK